MMLGTAQALQATRRLLARTNGAIAVKHAQKISARAHVVSQPIRTIAAARRKDAELVTSAAADIEDDTDADADAEGADADADGDADALLASSTPVMRVTCIRDRPRFDMPLLLGSISNTTRTAFACTYRGQRFILTAAGAVTYSTQIRLHVPGRSKPLKARVAHIGMECDLAVLRLEGASAAEEAGLWGRLEPLELGGLPQLQDTVSVIGAPPGQGSGEPRCMQGTVAQVEVTGYASSLQALLALTVHVRVAKEQIGAPVVNSAGACVGVVIRRTLALRQRTRGRRGSGSEDSAMAAPCTVLAQFLDGITTTGAYTGFPTLGIRYKKLESQALRKYLGLSEQEQQLGIVVLDINAFSSAAAALKLNDVLLKINEEPVYSDGTVPFMGASGRIPCTHYIAQQPVGSTLRLQVQRDGRRVAVEMRVEVPPRLMPTHLDNTRPPYLVVGGLVLTRCSVPYLEGAFGRAWVRAAPVSLLSKLTDFPKRAGEEVVVIAEVQTTLKSLDGYFASSLQHRRVQRFNGAEVLNMRTLATAVLRCKEPFLRFDLEGGITLVLPTAQANADTVQMLKEYEVRAPVSEDLADLLPPQHGSRRKALAGRQ